MATSGTQAAPAEEFSIETLLGSKLLEKAKTAAKPTGTLMKGKELIGLYFSASWCPPCKTFSPILASFYNAAAKAGNLEVVYISSDRTVADFDSYYAKMPWLSIPFEQGSAAIKTSLSQALKIQGIPTLVVIDAKTGEYITDSARGDVMKAGGDPAKAMAVIAQWKSMDRKPLSEGGGGGGGPANPIAKIFMFFAKNPMYVFALLYLYKWIKKNMNKWFGDPHAPATIEDDEEPAGEDSEF